MNNFIRKSVNICLITFTVIILAGLTSCGGKGGIIAVENKRPKTEHFVCISNTSGYTGGSMGTGADIEPNRTHEFEIEKDGTYWVLVGGVRYKEVSVSGGEMVHITID
jgi:hypothetical protein